MSGRSHREHPHLRFPEGTPPTLNYCVVSGKLTEDPWLGRNPIGEPVTVLRVEFPVTDPERSQTLWAWAACEVEVPDDLADSYGIRALQAGTPVLVAGQLSERWALAEGRSYSRPTIVAALVRAEALPGEEEG